MPDTTARPALLCLGNLTIDDVVLPDGSARPGCIGGDALYAVLAARPWEPTAQMVAPVGHNLPTSVSDGITRAGLATDGLPQRDRPTLHNKVVYDARGGRDWTLYNEESDFSDLSPRPDDIPAGYSGANRALVSAMALEAQEALVPFFAMETSTTTALDPQEDYIAGNEARLEALIRAVDIFLPSEEEVTRLTALTDWSVAARYFARLGPKTVVIKRGAAGVLVYDATRDAEFHVPPCDGAAVVDTTGAGDSFCGAFMAAIAAHPPEIAALAGAAAASFTVAGYGAAPLLETPADDISARFEAWRARSCFREDAPGRFVLTEALA